MAKQSKYKDNYLRSTFTYEGKRYYVYGKNTKELRENEVKKRIELEEKTDKYNNPTLVEYYKYFTSIRRSEVGESTLRAQSYQFNNIADVEIRSGIKFGKLHIRDITRRDIEMVRAKLLEAGKTPQNLNICFAHLNHVFAQAVLDETIDRNPCKALKKLKRNSPPVKETKHRALSKEETKKFFDAAKQRNSFYENAFLVMIKTGLRLGELTALYPSDIDEKNGFIHVRRSITRDEIGAYMVGEDAKTVSSVRDIPLTDELNDLISKQIKLNESVFGETNDLIFKSSENEILREYTLNREIKRICLEAGIDKFTCHAFRNTFATRFIEQRPQDYKILSEILGHKDVSITLNLYTHVMNENKVNAMHEIFIDTEGIEEDDTPKESISDKLNKAKSDVKNKSKAHEVSRQGVIGRDI